MYRCVNLKLVFKSGTPSIVIECTCVTAIIFCECVHVYMYKAVSESFERVLCCLDVASVVSSLSRCCVSSQVPRDL